MSFVFECLRDGCVIMLWYCVLDVICGCIVDVVTQLWFLSCRRKVEGVHSGWIIFEVGIRCLSYVGECSF